ncbi:MAG: transporter [Phycisphaerales bacterium]|nr:transporter [Phycisphaerales bacterium]
MTTIRRLAAAAGALGAAAALAGPPLITDDPDTPGENRWEINVAYTLEVSPRDGAAWRSWEHAAPLLDLNYGLFDNDQLKLEVPLTILDPADGESARAGIGDALIGYKLRLVDEESAPFSLSIYPQVGIPTGDSDRDLGTGSPSLKMPVQIGRHFMDDRLFLYADAGYEEQFTDDEADSWSAGVAAEYQITEGLTLCGELRYEAGLHGAADNALINLGAKCRLADSVTLMGAVGRSFDPPESGSSLMANFGVQFSF